MKMEINMKIKKGLSLLLIITLLIMFNPSCFAIASELNSFNTQSMINVQNKNNYTETYTTLKPLASQNIIESGVFGDNLSWSLDSARTLTISGDGAMYDRLEWQTTWSDDLRIENAVINNGVTNIGSFTFFNCLTISSIIIPDSVTSIGESAFYNCIKLKDVTIPNKVTIIGPKAFAECISLTSVTIPYSVTSIEESAFYDCSELDSITIENPDCVIYDSEYTIYSNTTIYGYEESTAKAYAEKYNREFISLGITPDVSKLTSGTCGDNLSWSFNENELTISGTGEMYDYDLNANIAPWSDYTDEIEKINIKDGLESIGAYAFYGCKNVVTLNIPHDVTAIGKNSISNCTALESITIPNTVKIIESHAFWNCTSLRTVKLSCNIESINEGAFLNCNNLSDVIYNGSAYEWRSVVIDTMNDELLNANIHYDGKVASTTITLKTTTTITTTTVTTTTTSSSISTTGTYVINSSTSLICTQIAECGLNTYLDGGKYSYNCTEFDLYLRGFYTYRLQYDYRVVYEYSDGSTMMGPPIQSYGSLYSDDINIPLSNCNNVIFSDYSGKSYNSPAEVYEHLSLDGNDVDVILYVSCEVPLPKGNIWRNYTGSIDVYITGPEINETTTSATTTSTTTTTTSATTTSTTTTTTMQHQQVIITTTAVTDDPSVIPEGFTPIYNIEDLYAVRNSLSGKYILMCDIDMAETAPGGDWDSGNGWLPIGDEKDGFSGKFDGNGHKLLNMHIYGNIRYAGLFGITSSFAKIYDLGMENVNIDVDVTYDELDYTIYSKGVCVGAIVGFDTCGLNHSYGYVEIDRCYVTGSINASVDSYASIGGLIGYNSSHYNGYTKYGMSDCYNFSNISVTQRNENSKVNVGGLAGYMSYMWNVYNAGKVESNINAYQIGGKEVEAAYYVNGISETDDIVSDGTRLTKAQAKTQGVYDFDFNEVWEIDRYCTSYPYPQLQKTPQVDVKEIMLLSPPTKLTYYNGERVDYTGSKLQITYDDGTVSETALNDELVEEYNTNTVGTKRITVTHRGKTTSFNIDIIESPTTKGDIDNNKSINASDASMILAEYAIIATNGTPNFTEEQMKAADVNEDGNVNALDASLVLAYYAHISTGGTLSLKDFISNKA